MTGSTILDSLKWPNETSVVALGHAVAAARGLTLKLTPIPDRLSHYELSGLTAVTGNTAYLFYSARLSPLSWEQTLLHEYAHILNGDVRADTSCTHLRTLVDDHEESRAEATGTLLLNELHRRQAAAKPLSSRVVEFVWGLRTRTRAS